MESLLPVWDIRTDKPGPELRGGGVPGLRAALEGLLSGPLATAAPPPEPAPPSSEAKPDNIASMSFQEAVTYMWVTLDKDNRVEWGDDGFAFNLQSKGYRDGPDRCKDPLFCWVNEKNKFWSAKTTTTFISLLDNYEREASVVLLHVIDSCGLP